MALIPQGTTGAATGATTIRLLLVVIASFTLIGGVARFSGLGVRDFWYDESCSFLYVEHLWDWAADGRLWSESTNLPYYVLLKGWVALWGESEATYRSLSALSATLTIPLLAGVCWQLGGRWAGVTGAVLLALHPLHVHYAHEARAYAVWVLLLSAALCALIEAARRPGWRWWTVYGLLILACLHVHYFSIYFLAAGCGCVFLSSNRAACLRRWAATSAAVVLAFVPYALVAVLPAARGGGGTWIADSFDPLTAIPESLWAFLPAGAYPAHLRGLSRASVDTMQIGSPIVVGLTEVLPAIIVGLALMVVAVRAADFGPRGLKSAARLGSLDGMRAARKDAIVGIGVMALGALLLPWLYSMAIRPHYLPGRYDLVAFPAFIVGMSVVLTEAACSFRERWRPWILTCVLAGLVSCESLPLARMRALRPPPSFHRLRAERLAKVSAVGDLAIVFSYDHEYLAFYLHRAGFRGSVASFPTWLDRQIGWVDDRQDLEALRRSAVAEDAARLAQRVRNTLELGLSVFVLGDSIDPRGDGPRSAIHEELSEALRLAGLRQRVYDAAMLMWIIERQAEPLSTPNERAEEEGAGR